MHPILIDRWSLAILVGIVAAFALCWPSRDKLKGAMTLSGLLLAMWTSSKVEAWIWSWDTARQLYPASDVFALTVARNVWREEPKAWKLGFIYAYLTKLVIHVIFWRDGVSTAHGPHELYQYGLTLNILVWIAILCVALAGGSALVAPIGSRLVAHWPGNRGLDLAGRRPAPRAYPRGQR